MRFPDLQDRFLRYVKIDTQSDENFESSPSTPGQWDLALLLEGELRDMGLDDVTVSTQGVVFATLKTNQSGEVPTIALIAHLDTSPDVSGSQVRPLIHASYDGGDIPLSQEDDIRLRVEDQPALKDVIGKTLITTDGNTLLGADDKAGIAEIMSAVHDLVTHPDTPRPNIRVLFTPDEEVGRGTENLKVEDIAADFGYTIDGGELGAIEDETFCADTLEIRIRGVNVHPGYAKGRLVNALKIAAEIVDAFPKDMLSPETTEAREGYLHPHLLDGAVEETLLKILVRDFEEKGLRKKEAFVKSLVDEISERYPGAGVDFKIVESYRNMKTVLDRYPKVIEKVETAVRMADVEPVRSPIRGGTDGARLSFMGLPTPNLFTGGHSFHSRYEWIAIEDMEKAAEVIVHLMGLWAEGD